MKKNPLIADSIKFKSHAVFRDDWSGFDDIKPINIIIGRNNAGKSRLIDLIGRMCAGRDQMPHDRSYQIQATLREEDLSQVFPRGTSGGELGRGDHWANHGRFFVGRKIEWETESGMSKIIDTRLIDGFSNSDDYNAETYKEPRNERINRILKTVETKLAGHNFRRLLADRDIQPEVRCTQSGLEEDGKGATDLIRRYLLSSEPSFPREVIQVELLNALNEVFGPDGQFTEIQVQYHEHLDERVSDVEMWEVYLSERHKRSVKLSSSGSGLKTVLLVLLNLIIASRRGASDPSKVCFAFEELENNLHPSLQRRLLRFIHSHIMRTGSALFITTHSNTVLDALGTLEESQIIHVTHNGKSAKTRTITAHFDKLDVISDLGAKPSDLLQANGIIWVEGPSDRIYINKWVSLLSDGELKEGKDYQCAFYGGALLAHIELSDPDYSNDELVNLITINANLVLICDSDRLSEDDALKPRVERFCKFAGSIPKSLIWTTGAKEIENYIPGEAWSLAFDKKELPDPKRFESFFRNEDGDGYFELNFGRKSYDKVNLATKAAAHITLENMKDRFDWAEQMRAIVKKIRSWNS